MAGKIISEGFTFDDVLIRPGASQMEPAEASLKTTIAGIELSVPFLSAAMDRVTEAKLAIELGKLGGLGVLHRNCSIEAQVAMVKEVKAAGVKVAAACGPFAADRAKALDEAGCDAIVIDCAHGHNLNVVESAKNIKKTLQNSKMIFGNIATGEAAKAVCGFVDAVKVGVGPGSICTTRIISGVGVPQLSAVLEVVAVAKKYNVPVIADGGMRTSGDIAKALAAGALDVAVRRIIAAGVQPVAAIAMGSLNIAETFYADRDLGSISPGRYADMLLIDDLPKLSVRKVIFGGDILVEGGKLLVEPPLPIYPDVMYHTVRMPLKPTVADFKVSTRRADGEVKVRCVGVSSTSLATEERHATLEARDGSSSLTSTKMWRSLPWWIA